MKTWLTLFLVSLLWSFSGNSAPVGSVTFRLVLTGESVSETLLNQADGKAAKSATEKPSLGHSRHLKILAEQASLEAELAKRGLQRINRTTVLLNSITVQAPESRRAELAAMPGVAAVYRVNQFSRSLVHSTPYVKAPAVWNHGSGFTGKGVRIGIIDSGIDYNHADFGGVGTVSAYSNNDPTVIEPGTFPTSKVAGGYDLAGDDYDSSGANGSSIPNPDPDPLDGPSGHGTHVAGIAGGKGVLSTGKTYTGPYGTSSYTNTFLVGPGVAPEASLYAIKIFGHHGTTGLVLDGLEWAADPNGDGTTSDHMDVVNLSLGSSFGETDSNSADETAIQHLVALGCVVAVAVGNDGNTPYITSWPSVSPEAIGVANIYDDGASFSSTRITAPAAVEGNYPSVEAGFTPKLAQVGPISATVVYTEPSDACNAIQNSGALKGKIALVDRGTCFFSDKVRALQNVGAVGVIVVNNVPGAPILMAGSGTTTDIKIPAVMISLPDGDLLKSQLTNGLSATLADSPAVVHPELADTIESSSSRGPTLQSSKLKPDLSAPGASIASVNGGSGTGAITYSGTSMATPHVAGAAALLKQEHPSWAPAEIKAALMNTSVPAHDQAGNRYGESRTGAGRLDAFAASQTGILLRNANALAEVSLSFGAFELLVPGTFHKTLQIDNKGVVKTLTLSVSNTLPDPGVTIALSTNTIAIGPGETKSIDVALTINPAALHQPNDPTSAAAIGAYPVQPLPEASGGIYASDGTLGVHVPWHVSARALSAKTAAAKTIGAPDGDWATLPIPTTGPSAHPAPLVSVFQFGESSSSQRLPFPDSGADLIGVGAATDLQGVASFDDARVFFGIAMAGKWTTPERDNINIDIDIDLNNDGIPDYTLSNSSQGNLTGGALETASLSNAALISVAHASGSTTALTGGSPWNIIPPAVRDTAAYQNGACVQSAKAIDLGITSTRTAFHYRVSTFGPGGSSDTTSWIAFDLAHPVIDATRFGINSSPFFDEGRTIQVLLNRTNAAPGAIQVQALLIHQHNLPGQQSETVNIRLDTPDADKNGLPDAWELKYFGQLGNSASADSDGDGATNAQEAAAGTDPTDSSSVFRIVSVVPSSTAPGLSVSWIGAEGYTYILERSTDLGSGFVAIKTGITGQAGTNTEQDPVPPAGQPRFYRVRVQ